MGKSLADYLAEGKTKHQAWTEMLELTPEIELTAKKWLEVEGSFAVYNCDVDVYYDYLKESKPFAYSNLITKAKFIINELDGDVGVLYGLKGVTI
ncbi:hypothetical protein [Caulobacter phage Cr30]|uniref:hypothetical protein n=1 Tax=Caulobacter phage Cr30 TaxID=1357714 RepID=UPI0004A9B979|nr:hypothetical protein OZ74_gp222 [Caulobacter phage Cr30]AGS81121.1 hypothetical protein [Caulobacter phage Cr30]